MTTEASTQPRRFDRRAIPPGSSESYWNAQDGQRIRRFDWPVPVCAIRGSLLFLPGRGDIYEKYLETFDHWHGNGWQVTSLDWRGQAFSGRLGMDEHTGHIDDFSIWIDDLAEFWQRWRSSSPGPHVLIGHSMGGHILLRALAENRVDPQAAVLSAPMLGFRAIRAPLRVQHFLARLMTRLGDPRRPAWRGTERPEQIPGDRMLRITHDRDRYADESWWRKNCPELALGAPSWGWIESAMASMRHMQQPGFLESIRIPLLFLSASADRLVDPRSIDQAVKRIEGAQLVRFGSESRHEILRETDAVRDRAIAEIDDFLGRAALVDG